MTRTMNSKSCPPKRAASTLRKSRTKMLFGATLIAVGLFLSTLNVAGLVTAIPEHPIADVKTHKHGLKHLSYADALEALSRIDPGLPANERLARVNEIIAARVVHYWPNPGQTDRRVMHSPLENWYMALVQRAEAWLAKSGLAKIDLARVGRRDHRDILAKGVGLCGMAALAVVDHLNEQGADAKILALGGHVVGYVSLEGRNFILDPDKAVLISDVETPPKRSVPQILAAYANAGYDSARIAKLERIYTKSAMKLLTQERFQGRWRRTLFWANILKWLIPACLLGTGRGAPLARRP